MLHALRDRLTSDEVVHLGPELPMIIRGVYFEGFDIKNPSRNDDLDEFLNAVTKEMGNAATTISPERCMLFLYFFEEKLAKEKWKMLPICCRKR